MEIDNKNKYNKLKIILFMLPAILLVVVILNIVISSDTNAQQSTQSEQTTNELVLKEEYIVEVGSILPSIEDYYVSYKSNSKEEIKYYLNNQELSIEDITNKIDGNNYLKEVNEYQVLINNVDKTILKVVDTTPPTVTLKELTITLGDKYNIESFILEYKDNSNENDYIVTFIDNNEEITTKGIYNIKLRICDLYNNCVDKDTKLIVNENKNTNNKSTLNSNSNNNSSSNSNSTYSNNSSNKPSNKTSNKTSNGSSAVNSSNNTSNHSSSNSNSQNSDKNFVDYVVEKKVLKTEIKYGTKIISYANVKYAVYSDGSKEEISRSSTFIDYDYKSYNGTTIQMKREAESLYITQEESRNIILNKTNEYRKELGVDKLTLDKDLSIIATIKAIELAYSGNFDHTRPTGKPWYSIHEEYYSPKSIPFTAKAENLAYNNSTELSACEQWRNSSSHYKTMTNKKYTKIGIGKYTLNGIVYYVQEFGG